MCFVLLDLSAAFDGLEHSLIINRLKYQFGIVGKCLDWFEDYLLNRTQCVTVCDSTGTIAELGKHILKQGIPQGSVLGLLIFNLFLSPLGEIYRSHGINFSGYADDSQNYLSFRPIKDNLTPQHNCTEHLERCLAEVWTWMRYNFLKLNDSKTEFIVFGVCQQLSKVQDITVTLGDDTNHETPVVRNLGMFFDKELKHTAHVNRLTSSSFHCLQNVARIRHQLDTQTVKTIVQALVISKLDYCNSILLGISNYNIAKLQPTQNMACRMVYKLPKSLHITQYLFNAHWLKIPQRIEFKVISIMYRCVNNTALEYLRELVLSDTGLPECTLRSNSRSLLPSSLSRISLVHDCSFKSQGLRLWNRVNIDIRNATNYTVFKDKLKTFLFRECYANLFYDV